MQTRSSKQKLFANEFDNKLGYMMKRKRKEKKRFTNGAWRQKDMALILGVSIVQYQKYESGINQISARNLVKLANILDLTEEEKLSIFEITEEEINK